MDRALGTLQDNDLVPIIGAQFINNTGTDITQVPITYVGEQWRSGLNLGTDCLDFQYSTDAVDLNSGTWNDVNELDSFLKLINRTAIVKLSFDFYPNFLIL